MLLSSPARTALATIVAVLGTASAAQAAPVLTFTGSPPPARTSSASVGITVTSSEPVTWSNCSLTNWFPGATPACDGLTNQLYSSGFNVPQEGQHTFAITGTSIANGSSTTVSRTWVLDTVPPDTHVNSGPSGGAAITGTQATWTFSAGGVGAGDSATFDCRLDDGAWETCTSPYLRSGLTDGAHTFEVRARDQATNVDPTPATASFTVNNGPPTASIASVAFLPFEAGETVYTAVTQPTWTFSLSRPDALAQCSLDDSEFADCGTSSFTAPFALPDGEHTFRVRARLPATGAVQDPAVESVVVVDTQAPTLSFTSAPAAHVAGDSVEFEYGADEPGVSYACVLDSGPILDPCPTTFTGLSEGEHGLELWGSDRANNSAPAVTHRWRNHVTQPETTFTGAPDPNVEVGAASFSFISQPGNTFECKVDAGDWKPCTSPATVSGLVGGEHTFAVRAVDPAGQRDPSPAEARWRQTALPAPLPPAGGGDPGPSQSTPSAGLARTGPAKVAAKRGRYTVTTGFAAACAATSPSPCAGSATLSAALAKGRARTRLGTATIRVAPGRQGAIRITLSKRLSKRLSRLRKVSATLVVRLPDAGGKQSSTRRTLKLRVPRLR